MRRTGRHFLQIPGPTNVPDRVLRAMGQPTIDHRGPDLPVLAGEIVEGLRSVFNTTGLVITYPGSATGGWEAALANTLSPGDRVLMFDHGYFSATWEKVALRLGLQVHLVPGDWRRAVDPNLVESMLREDTRHEYKAVLLVHNETSTGVTSRIADIRRAMDSVSHPALLMVDSVSSLGSIEYLHDDWGVDVTISGSQKGMMMPPGLCFHAVSEKALGASESAKLPRSYWDWKAMLAFNETGFLPYTPATNLLYGLKEALSLLNEEGLDHVYARHARHAEATRRAVEGWGLEIFSSCREERSSTVTTVMMPDRWSADEFRAVVLERFDMSLGGGLGKLRGAVFRIGHLGDFNDLMLAGTLAGVELGLIAGGIPHENKGVRAALDFLAEPTS